jgi:thiamine biosynthesis lipoprotein
MTFLPTRRRFLGISGAAIGVSVLPLAGARPEAEAVTWRGQAMGAVCTLRIHHTDRVAAGRLVERAVAEVRRLERIFSLYDPDSALVRLNRTGFLEAPPAELVSLLDAAQAMARLTDGAFDVTVQPLWTLYARHFAEAGADLAGPPAGALREALSRTGYWRVESGRQRIAIERGMSLTLNGIAQGFVTDRVVDLLRAEGIDRSLVDMGEPRVLGVRPDGSPWSIAVADPTGNGPGTILPVIDRAVATSAPSGFRFDLQGRFNHIFRPSDGGCAWRYASVSVVARDATLADALSTAFSLMPQDAVRSVASRAGLDLVLLVDEAGTATRIGS